MQKIVELKLAIRRRWWFAAALRFGVMMASMGILRDPQGYASWLAQRGLFVDPTLG